MIAANSQNIGEAAGRVAFISSAAAGVADPDNPPTPSGDALDAFRKKWPGVDPYGVIDKFQDKWRAEGCAVIRSPDGAFLKFAEGMFKARTEKRKKTSRAA